MRSSSCFKALAALAASLAPALLAGQSFRGFHPASIVPPSRVAVKPGQETVVRVEVRIRPGYHINSHQPNEEYLIPTRLRWENAGLKVRRVEYPEAETVRYEFSEEPLSVYSGKIAMVSVFEPVEKIPEGLTELQGTLHYQACTEKVCLPPKTLPVKVPVESR